jgi:hypothetical protein
MIGDILSGIIGVCGFGILVLSFWPKLLCRLGWHDLPEFRSSSGDHCRQCGNRFP